MLDPIRRGHRDWAGAAIRSGLGGILGRAMSPQNIETVRRMLAAYAKGDFDEMLDCIDPECELHSAIIGGAEANVFHGHEGFRRWYAESMASFEELRTELTEYRDLGDRVLGFGHIFARGRESGVEIDSPTGWVFTLRDGKVVRAEGYLKREDALAAAGLTE